MVGPKSFHLRVETRSVGCTAMVDGESAGIVSAGWTRDCWWLERVKVNREHRGLGLAEEALRRVTSQIARMDGPRVLQVCPGGYGSNVRALMRWYRIQGFREVDIETMEFNLDKGPQ